MNDRPDPGPPPEDSQEGEEGADPSGFASPGPAVAAGRLLDPAAGDRLEEEDRKKPIPGGEPECPLCGRRMTRRVERHPAPRGGASPFRVRLVCVNEECGAWTVYDW